MRSLFAGLPDRFPKDFSPYFIMEKEQWCTLDPQYYNMSYIYPALDHCKNDTRCYGVVDKECDGDGHGFPCHVTEVTVVQNITGYCVYLPKRKISNCIYQV